MTTKFQWTLEMDTLLGTRSDWDVADELGMHKRTVRLRRLVLGIPAFGRNVGIDWTSEMDVLLGTMVDEDVADTLGMNRSSVRNRREVLGIPSFGWITWTPEMDALLGTMMDKEVAAQFGIGIGTVTKRRNDLGVSSWMKQNRILPEGLCKYDPEAQCFYQQRRRAKRLRLLDTLTYEQWKFACEWFNNKCAYCGEEAFLTEDHLVPLSKRGPRTVLNIVPTCLLCNQSKGARRAHLWIYWKFGMREGKEIIEHLVAYLREVQERWH